ncbi:MAG: oligosaccharide flippase family protein [Tepidiformaceae bacterium]
MTEDGSSAAPRRWKPIRLSTTPLEEAVGGPNVASTGGDVAESLVEHEVVAARVRPMLRTAGALLSVQGLTWLTSLATILLVPRLLGVDRLGTFATLSTVAGLLSLVAGLGTTNHLVREVARDPANSANLVAHVVVVRLAIWLAFTAAAVVFTITILQDQYLLGLVVVSLLSTGLGLVSGTLMAALQGNQTLGRAAIFGAVLAVFGQTVALVVLARGGGILALYVAGLCFSIVGCAVVASIFWQRLMGPIHFSRTTWKLVVAGGVPFLAWELALQIYGASDYIMLAALTDSRTVGAYSFAYRIAGIPIFVATIITASVFASLATSAANDARWFRTVLTLATRTTLVCTLPMAVGIAVLAPEITRSIGGQSFGASTPLLIILAFHIPLAATHTILGTSLFAMDRQKVMVIVGWIAAVFNVLLNAVAIPLSVHFWSNGAIGSSVCTLATECFMGLWIWRAVGARLDRRAVIFAGARSLVACAGMGVAVRLLVPIVGFPIVVPLGAMIYIALAVQLRVVSIASLRELLSHARLAGGPKPVT